MANIFDPLRFLAIFDIAICSMVSTLYICSSRVLLSRNLITYNFNSSIIIVSFLAYFKGIGEETYTIPYYLWYSFVYDLKESFLNNRAAALEIYLPSVLHLALFDFSKI